MNELNELNKLAGFEFLISSLKLKIESFKGLVEVPPMSNNPMNDFARGYDRAIKKAYEELEIIVDIASTEHKIDENKTVSFIFNSLTDEDMNNLYRKMDAELHGKETYDFLEDKVGELEGTIQDNEESLEYYRETSKKRWVV